MTTTELRELAEKWRRNAEYFRENIDEYAYEEKTLSAANVFEDCADQLIETLQACAECGKEAEIDTTQQTDGPDQYAKLCRAMEEGLLITVNNADSTTEISSDELTVVSGGDPALLRGRNGEVYHLGTNYAGNTVLADVDMNGSTREMYVETIEILGMAGSHKFL